MQIPRIWVDDDAYACDQTALAGGFQQEKQSGETVLLRLDTLGVVLPARPVSFRPPMDGFVAAVAPPAPTTMTMTMTIAPMTSTTTVVFIIASIVTALAAVAVWAWVLVMHL